MGFEVLTFFTFGLQKKLKMRTSLSQWLQNQWKDPVWSKVIAAAIIAVIGTPLWGLYQSSVQNINFWDSLYALWILKIPLWLVLIMNIFIIAILLPRTKLAPSTIITSEVSNDAQDDLGNTRILYDGANPSLFDFETSPKQDWDPGNQKRFGDTATGEFRIIDNIIVIKRTNTGGQYQLRLVKYSLGNTISHVIPKDLSKEGKRRFRVSGLIKNSGNGSQKVIFVLRNENELTWLDNRTEIVSSENWQLINFVLHGSFLKDVIIRIDSTTVVNPPNSLYIKDLMVREYV